MRKGFKEIREVKDINVFSKLPKFLKFFNSIFHQSGDSDYRNKPPFYKGRFGGNVNMKRWCGTATTTILRVKKKALPSGKALHIISATRLLAHITLNIVVV